MVGSGVMLIWAATGSFKPEMTPSFDSLVPFCVGRLLKVFVYVVPFKSYSIFSFWLDFPKGGQTFTGF
jgi:hypothetical protein